MTASRKPLAGKVALVTGGARGLGAATAVALAEQGADVAITFVSPESVSKAAGVVAGIEKHDVRGLSIQSDQAVASHAPQVINAIVERLGRLDIVVNSASIDRFGAADDPNRDDAVFDHYWAVANSGFRAIVQAASRVMGEGACAAPLKGCVVCREASQSRASIQGHRFQPMIRFTRRGRPNLPQPILGGMTANGPD